LRQRKGKAGETFVKIRLFRRPDRKDKLDRVERAYRAMIAEREMDQKRQLWFCMRMHTKDF
jgi:bisphosphoglycerate-independent phosphoglycerate mutase (AlkP superfamily)